MAGSGSLLQVGNRVVQTLDDGTEVEHRVTWVGKKKARLHADLGFAWQTTTVWIDRVEASPWWRAAE